jgi:hypothetical protein
MRERIFSVVKISLKFSFFSGDGRAIEFIAMKTLKITIKPIMPLWTRVDAGNLLFGVGA